jgi:hypothetical protein
MKPQQLIRSSEEFYQMLNVTVATIVLVKLIFLKEFVVLAEQVVS